MCDNVPSYPNKDNLSNRNLGTVEGDFIVTGQGYTHVEI